MRPARELFLHLGLLGLGAAVAIGVWTRDKEAKALVQAEATVWSGRPGDVEQVVYDAKKKKVTLESRKDAAGRYFVGTFDRETALPEGDAGAPPPQRTVSTFVSVAPAEKLAEALAPLKALRDLGKIGDDRAAEFGLADPEATLTVKLAGVERKLLLGSATPGGGDRYARDPVSSEVYVLRGTELRNLESADSMLLERDLHEWKDADVTRARLAAGGKARELVRGGTEAKRFWADAASPDANDETVGNWMSKLERLRPAEYRDGPPPGKESLVRVEYVGGGKTLGFVELVKAPPAPGSTPASVTSPKADYFLATERTRLYAKVPAVLAEQVEQDIAGLVK